MTTYTCPDGHASSMGDYCDVCGRPIPAGAGAAPAGTAPEGTAPAGTAPGGAAPDGAAPKGTAPAAVGNLLDLDAPVPPPLPGAPSGSPAGSPASTASAPADQFCENCGAPRPPDDLFCEVCGYDFTTGQLPRPLDPPAGTPAAGTPVSPPADAAAGPLLAPPVTPTSAPGHVEWVAEVWIDPDWYAAQDVADPCPSPGVPWVIPILERTVLIGRLSTSRNIHPQIDVSTDSGVSRRHAQLSSDGQRWWVEDLQSANGTYVGSAGAPLPTEPIVAGQRVELADDDRVYLGAWTRLVVRRATPEEASLGG